MSLDLDALLVAADRAARAGGEIVLAHFGSPPACAAALATLDTIARDDLGARAHTLGAAWIDELGARGRGLMVGVELRGVTSAAVVAEALARGLWVYPAGSGAPVADAVMVAPPFTVTDADIERIVTILAAAIDATPA